MLDGGNGAKRRINLCCIIGGAFGALSIFFPWDLHSSIPFDHLEVVVPLFGICSLLTLYLSLAAILQDVIFVLMLINFGRGGIELTGIESGIALALISVILVTLGLICPIGPGYHFKPIFNPLKWPRRTIIAYSDKIRDEPMETRAFYDRVLSSGGATMPPEKASQVDSTVTCHRCGKPAPLGFDLCDSCRAEIEDPRRKRKCPFCEAEVSERDIICDSCGMDLAENYECPSCHAAAPSNYDICPKCGHSKRAARSRKKQGSEKAASIVCPSCGKHIKSSERSCPYCWQKLKGKLERECPICGHINAPGSRICEMCRRNMSNVRKCLSCEKLTPKEYNVCSHCGFDGEGGGNESRARQCQSCGRYYPDRLSSCPYCWHDSARRDKIM